MALEGTSRRRRSWLFFGGRDLEDGSSSLRRDGPKSSLGVLNDNETLEVPGSVLLLAPDRNEPLGMHKAPARTSHSSIPSGIGVRLAVDEVQHRKRTKDGRIILDPQPEDSLNDPLNWAPWRRDFSLLSLGLYCMLGGGLTPLLAAGFTNVAHDYDVSVDRVSLSTGLYMMGLGLGSVVFSPTAILYGKRPVYLFSVVLLIAASAWCASSPTFTSLLLARIFQGMAVSPVECLPSATIAEIFFLHERAFRIGIYTMLLLGGKNLIPLVSAAIIQALSWRWAFWVVAFVAAFCGVLLFLFVPETFWDRAPIPKIARKASGRPSFFRRLSSFKISDTRGGGLESNSDGLVIGHLGSQSPKEEKRRDGQQVGFVGEGQTEHLKALASRRGNLGDNPHTSHQEATGPSGPLQCDTLQQRSASSHDDHHVLHHEHSAAHVTFEPQMRSVDATCGRPRDSESIPTTPSPVPSHSRAGFPQIPVMLFDLSKKRIPSEAATPHNAATSTPNAPTPSAQTAHREPADYFGDGVRLEDLIGNAQPKPKQQPPRMAAYTSTLRDQPALSFLQSMKPYNGRLNHDKWHKVAARPFILFSYPAVLWSAAVYACSVGWLIVISESVAVIYRPASTYGFNAIQTGLVYVSPFVGGILGTVVAGRVSDIIVQAMARRNGGLYEPEFRLVMALPVAICTTAGLMGFGWSAQIHDHWIVPTLLFGLVSLGCTLGSTTAITFCVDSYRQYAGEALVTLNFTKNICHGLVFGFFITSWITSDGPKTVYIWLGVIQLILLTFTIPMYIFGKRARMWTVRKNFMEKF